MTYRLVKLLTAVLCVGFLVGCGSGGGNSKGGSSGQAGQIPGLGLNTGSEVQGAPYNLPDGISLKTDIYGANSSNLHSENYYSMVTSPSNGHDKVVGSGYPVTLIVELVNTNSYDKEVVFPAGLIVTSKRSDGLYKIQNGILLRETKVSVPANSSSYKVILVLYCVNLGIPDAWGGSIFDGWVVTNSALLQDLIKRLENKKINVEEYTSATESKYNEIYKRLSTIVWSITNGKDDQTFVLYEFSIFGKNYTHDENMAWIAALD
jgi:hypothetical protein